MTTKITLTEDETRLVERYLMIGWNHVRRLATDEDRMYCHKYGFPEPDKVACTSNCSKCSYDGDLSIIQAINTKIRKGLVP